mmetsp:Transcript_22996/g.45936  ORF Transcript_22996/g.45936 Transcript_22996/m.45936 type:complete len:438 (-) Transcript_22996:819-2132(-)
MVHVHLQHRLVHPRHLRLSHGHRLRLHVPLHGRGEPVGPLHQRRGRLREQVRAHGPFDAVAQPHLEEIQEVRVFLVLGLHGRLLVVVPLVQVEALLGHVHEIVVLVFLQVLHHHLVQGVDHEEHVEALLLELFERGAHPALLFGGARDVIDFLLLLRHGTDVVVKGDVFITRSLGEPAAQGGNVILCAVVLNNANFEVFPKVIPEHHILGLVLVRLNIPDHVHALLHQPLVDDGERARLLQNLPPHIERQVVAVHDTPHELEPPRNQSLEGVVDEHPLDVQLHVLGVLVEHIAAQVEGQGGGDEEERLGLHRALDGEMAAGDGLVEGLEGGFVELAVVPVLAVARGTEPQWFRGFDGHVRGLRLWDGLGLGFLPLDDLSVLVRHLDVLGGALEDGDGEFDEAGVALQQVRELARLEVLQGVLLQFENEARPAPLDGF